MPDRRLDAVASIHRLHDTAAVMMGQSLVCLVPVVATHHHAGTVSDQQDVIGCRPTAASNASHLGGQTSSPDIHRREGRRVATTGLNLCKTERRMHMSRHHAEITMTDSRAEETIRRDP